MYRQGLRVLHPCETGQGFGSPPQPFHGVNKGACKAHSSRLDAYTPIMPAFPACVQLEAKQALETAVAGF